MLLTAHLRNAILHYVLNNEVQVSLFKNRNKFATMLEWAGHSFVNQYQIESLADIMVTNILFETFCIVICGNAFNANDNFPLTFRINYHYDDRFKNFDKVQCNILCGLVDEEMSTLRKEATSTSKDDCVEYRYKVKGNKLNINAYNSGVEIFFRGGGGVTMMRRMQEFAANKASMKFILMTGKQGIAPISDIVQWKFLKEIAIIKVEVPNVGGATDYNNVHNFLSGYSKIVLSMEITIDNVLNIYCNLFGLNKFITILKNLRGDDVLPDKTVLYQTNDRGGWGLSNNRFGSASNILVDYVSILAWN